MVHRIVSDGPLLIFCQLGYLATSTIPHHRSGLERKDIKRVFNLQHELILDQLLPLNGASDTVWEDLRQLRKQVEGLCGAIFGGTGNTGNVGDAGEEGGLLQTLLRRIDYVRNLRVVVGRRLARNPAEQQRRSARQPQAKTIQFFHTCLSSFHTRLFLCHTCTIIAFSLDCEQIQVLPILTATYSISSLLGVWTATISTSHNYAAPVCPPRISVLCSIFIVTDILLTFFIRLVQRQCVHPLDPVIILAGAGI